MNINDLIDQAHTLNVQVTWHRNGPKGAWIPHQCLISIREGMSETQTLCTLAHELGHAYHGDTPTNTGYYPARIEHRADEYAANLLISPTEYRLLERIYEHDTATIAAELEVTQHLLEVWRNAMERRRLAG